MNGTIFPTDPRPDVFRGRLAGDTGIVKLLSENHAGTVSCCLSCRGRRAQRTVCEGKISLAGKWSIRQTNDPGRYPPQDDPRLYETQIDPVSEQRFEWSCKPRCVAGGDLESGPARTWRTLDQQGQKTPLHDAKYQYARQEEEARDVGTTWRPVWNHWAAAALPSGGCVSLSSILREKVSRIQPGCASARYTERIVSNRLDVAAVSLDARKCAVCRG